MKLTILAPLALAAVAYAQAPTLPDCAQTCASQFLAGGIGDCGSDPKCICSNQQFLAEIACCLAKPGGCGPAEQAQAVNFARSFCVAQGVQVPTAVSCASLTPTATPTPNANNNGTITPQTTTTSRSTGGVSRPTAAPVAAAGVLGGFFAAVAML